MGLIKFDMQYVGLCTILFYSKLIENKKNQ